MDQIKIGRFIAECRKKQNLTQMQLAERLGITDKAISKWERGIAMPDSSIMLELCEELFCHIFDATEGGGEKHRHIFNCQAPSSVILHLLQHLQKNDNKILDLLSCESNELFLRYFKENLRMLIEKCPQFFCGEPPQGIPAKYWINHISVTFVESVRWWIDNGMQESAQTIADYFDRAVRGQNQSAL